MAIGCARSASRPTTGLEAVPPDDFRDFMLRLSLRGFVGANVTIPHKEPALALVEPGCACQAVGAANTLWLADGELCSTNTDVEGFINNLDAAAPGWDNGVGCAGARRRRLGAGGGLWPDRARLHTHSSRQPHARSGKGAAPSVSARPCIRSDGTRSEVLLPRAGLLVNTTSLGMNGQPPLEIDVGLLPGECRGRRSGLCAAGDAISWRPRGPAG